MYQMNDNTDNDKRFLFMPSWIRTALTLPEEQGNSLLRAIAIYGAFGDVMPTDDVVVNAMMMSVIPIIKKSIEKYNKACTNGSTGGRPEKISTADVQEQKMQGKTQAQVAKDLQVSEATVRRKWKLKNDNEKEKKKENEKEKYNEKEIKVTTGDTLELCTVMTGYDGLDQTTPSQSTPPKEKINLEEMTSSLDVRNKNESDQVAIEHMYAVLSRTYFNTTKEGFTTSLLSGCKDRGIDVSDVFRLFDSMIDSEIRYAQSKYSSISTKAVGTIMRAILDEAKKRRMKIT